jgi:hypothetical protein
MIAFFELQRIVEEVVLAYFKVLSWHLYGRTKHHWVTIYMGLL